MISLPRELSPGDRFCDSRKGGMREVGGVTRRVKMVPAKPCAACRAHLLEPRGLHAVF